MLRILVIDNDTKALGDLKTELALIKPDWQITTLSSPATAAELVEQHDYDMVLTELKMPYMVGDQLLKHIGKCSRQTLRIIMSSEKEKAEQLTSLGAAHQFVAKPVNPKEVVELALRAHSLRNVLRDAKLTKLLSKTSGIPALPDTYLKIIRLLRREDYLQSALIETLSQDPAVVSQILKVANSALFGRQRKIASIMDAVTLLGTNTIRTIVLAVETFGKVDKEKFERFHLQGLCDHCFEVGSLAAKLAAQSPETRKLKDDALTAGVMHDIGKLILIDNHPEDYQGALDFQEISGVSLIEAEEKVFGCTHQEVGAYVLGLWSLPDSIVEAVAYHHQPELCNYNRKCVLSFVAAANVLADDYSLRRHDSEAKRVASYLEDIGAELEAEKVRFLIESAST